MTPRIRYSLLALCLVVLTACDSGKEKAQTSQPSDLAIEAMPESGLKTRGLINFWQFSAQSCYSNASLAIREFEGHSQLFLAHPTQQLLLELRDRWNTAHQAYLACQLYQMLAFSRSGQKQLELTKQRVNAWPIQGGYIDYLPGYQFTGIINDSTLAITLDNLLSQHQFSDLSDVSVGFHALEFLLWGEGFDRPASDFQASDSQLSEQGIELDANNRRRTYFELLTSHIIAELDGLSQRWERQTTTNGTYLDELPPGAQLSFLLTSSYRVLNDYLLERLISPFRGGDGYEVNESPYSKTTLEGMITVLDQLGHWLDGTVMEEQQNLLQFVTDHEPELADQIRKNFKACILAIDGLGTNYPAGLAPDDKRFLLAQQQLGQLITDLVNLTESLNLRLQLY
jgi:putative iron-regulated protein